MHARTRFVEVRQIPESLDNPRKRDFYRDFGNCIKVDRPAVVLDCSKVRQMDRNAILLLLWCLEEAMKRNGDVKLAAVNPDAGVLLRSYGLDRVFEIFDTIKDALESFSCPGFVMRAYARTDGSENRVSDNAAKLLRCSP